MSKSQSFRSRRLFRGGIAAAAITASVLAAGTTPAFAANVPLTLSQTAGPAAAADEAVKVTASAATAWLAGVTTPQVTLTTAATCQATYNAAASTPTATNIIVVGGSVTRLSNYYAMVALPPLALSPASAASTRYSICFYSGTSTSDQIIGSAGYTVAPAVAITSVTPSTGPAVAGNQITVVGSGFPTTAGALTATLGGIPLTGISVINSGSFTATVPPNSAGAKNLTVTTAAGATTAAAAYTYANGINIEPNTARSDNTSVWLNVMGAGFTNVAFSNNATIPATATGRVYLVDGEYDEGAGAAGTYVNGPQANCGLVTKISDNQLVCKLDLTLGLTKTTALDSTADVPVGTYTITVVNNGAGGSAAVPTFQTEISSGATFTVANY